MKEINYFLFKQINMNIFNNLPKTLKSLTIYSYKEPNFRLDNLPNLVNLELYGKFDLNHLPDSLKCLKCFKCILKFNFIMRFNIPDTPNYKLDELLNLPVGLREIYIDELKFMDLKELVENYEKN